MACYQALFLFFNFPANHLYDKYGMLLPTVIASICFIGGGWLRILTNHFENGFWFLLAGQTIAGIGWTFIVQAPTKIAIIWFGDKERSIATTICSLGGPLGCIIGFVIPIFFLTVDPLVTPEKSKEEMGVYIFWQTVIVTVLSAPILLLIRNKPKNPPS